MNPSKILVSTLLVGAISTANATVITYGSLSTSDEAGELFVTDAQTGRLYSRQDAFDMSYADTLSAIAAGSGSPWEGWQIANSQIADEFVSAFLFDTNTNTSSSTCGGADPFGVACGTIPGWVDNSFGASWDDNLDSFAFLSTEDTPGGRNTLIGNVHIHGGNTLAMFDESWGIATLDGAIGPHGVDLLLYNDNFTPPPAASSIPEPSPLFLFGLGLMGLGYVRKHRSGQARLEIGENRD